MEIHQATTGFDQIATFAEKVFTCPVITLPGDEATTGARDASDLADSTFPNGTGACTELSHYMVRETQPPEDYTFGRVLFTPGSGDDATLVSMNPAGVIVLNTTNDDSVMLHVYNFTGEGGVSPGSQPPSTPPSSGGEQGVKGSTGVPNTSISEPGPSLLLGALSLLVLTGSLGALATANVRSTRRRRR